jgi:hypothetical protein
MPGGDGMTDSPSRSGSLFALGEAPTDALPDFLQFIHRQALHKKTRERLREILEAWFGLCTESPDGLTDRDTLGEAVDITRPGLIHNLKKLEELGLLQRSERRPDQQRRRVVFYELQLPRYEPPSVDDLPDLFDRELLQVADADSARLEERHALEEVFRHPDSVTCSPTNPEKTTFKGERLTVFTLAPALNVGRQGAVTEKTTRIWRGSRSFEVTVRALTGHRIPNVQDLRPLVVAWTLARDQLPHMGDSAPAVPVFVMSLKTICEHLGFATPTANHLRQTFNRIRRFRSSEWQLTDDRYNVLRNFRKGGVLERDKYMSFISDLEVVSTVGAHGKTPEIIAITFHPAFTPVITDMNRSLTMHKEFIQGKAREFDQLVYQWCRTTVQHNHDPQEYALERVHREAHPSVSLVQFRQGLERMLTDKRYERIPDAGYPMALIPGYLLAVDFAVDKLVASARNDDFHLGTTSKYALAKLGQRRAAGGGQPPQRPKPPPEERPSDPDPRPNDRLDGESNRQYGTRKLGDLLAQLKVDAEKE